MSSIDRMPVKDRIYSHAFDFIKRRDYQVAGKYLDQIPPQFRDIRWILQSEVIKKRGTIQVVKKSLSDIFSQADSSSCALQIRLSVRGAKEYTNKIVFLGLLECDRITTTNPFSTDLAGGDKDNIRNIRAILDAKQNRLFECRNNTRHFSYQSSSEVWRTSYCEIFEKTDLGGRPYASVDARIESAGFNSEGALSALAQRKFEKPSWLDSTEVGSKQIGGSLQFLTFNPAPIVTWSISDEPLFSALLLPEITEANISTIEHRSGTKFFRSSNHLAHLPFEYYDSRLRQNIFGIYSIRDMKLARIAAVNRKDEKERDFTAARIIQEPKRWSEFDESKILQLADSDLSNVELPPKKRRHYSLNLGERWGEVNVQDGVISVGNTPIFKLSDPSSKAAVDTVWSTAGETVAFLTVDELWIVNFLDKNSAQQTENH